MEKRLIRSYFIRIVANSSLVRFPLNSRVWSVRIFLLCAPPPPHTRNSFFPFLMLRVLGATVHATAIRNSSNSVILARPTYLLEYNTQRVGLLFSLCVFLFLPLPRLEPRLPYFETLTSMASVEKLTRSFIDTITCVSLVWGTRASIPLMGRKYLQTWRARSRLNRRFFKKKKENIYRA